MNTNGHQGAGRRLTRERLAAAGEVLPKPPERIVHLGLGAFHRAHQAWYTARAADAPDWGIVGFTGRSPDVAHRLGPQDGVFTLVERGPESDRFGHIGSVVAAVPGDRLDRLVAAVAARTTAVVTLTVTEAGYRLAPDGGPDLADPEVAADVERLLLAFDDQPADPPATALGRLLLALHHRHRLVRPPIALVSCDNLPANGHLLRSALLGLADAVAPSFAHRLPDDVAFVSSSVDRITPRAGRELGDLVRDATGWDDAAPVVTEPFADWVLAGEFPAGRPAWESAGATIVTDLEPYEARKLWLLNGAHLVLAFGGALRGHATVADAFDDSDCRLAVERLWDDAAPLLPDRLDVPAYRSSLAARFRNPRIEHRLSQIAEDGLIKLRIRIAPVAEQRLRHGADAAGCAIAMGAWIAALMSGLPASGGQRPEIGVALQGADPVPALLWLVSDRLAADRAFCDAVGRAAQRWGAR